MQRMAEGNIWIRVFPESRVAHCTVLETIYIIESYQNVYTQLIEMIRRNDSDNDMFWHVIYKEWQRGPKSVLWNVPLANAYFRPPRDQPQIQMAGLNNIGFYARIHMQQGLKSLANDMIDQKLDILQLPRSIPSIRNMLYKITCVPI